MNWTLFFKTVYDGNFLCALDYIKGKIKVIVFEEIAYTEDREVLSLCKCIPYYFSNQEKEIQAVIHDDHTHVDIGAVIFDVWQKGDIAYINVLNKNREYNN